jgi:D-beta-D-heptose 7-phosphate kinase/D-beta-D-heptose 1-phosphate adenosyltransferase
MSDEYKEILARFPDCRLAVVGDCMIDRFLWGSVDRISPEAPVPVVRLERETAKLGGAANVASNLRALGAEVTLVAVCGRDEPAELLHRLLAQRGIATEGLIEIAARPTTIKTRIIAHNQQVVRTDLEHDEPLPAAVADQLVTRLRDLGPFGGIVLSDYGKGVLAVGALRQVIAEAQRQAAVAVVDPKTGDFSQYRGVTSLTPNQKEAELACAMKITGEHDLAEAGSRLLERTGAEAVLITRGEHGMALFERQGTAHYLATEATHVYDVTGAGDTVIAAYTTALVAGASYVTAASLANHAAGIAVRELGTCAVSADQIAAAVGLK